MKRDPRAVASSTMPSRFQRRSSYPACIDGAESACCLSLFRTTSAVAPANPAVRLPGSRFGDGSQRAVEIGVELVPHGVELQACEPRACAAGEKVSRGHPNAARMGKGERRAIAGPTPRSFLQSERVATARFRGDTRRRGACDQLPRAAGEMLYGEMHGL